MSELGQLLKNARLEKNLSLDDVQEATKIRKRYLEAIEEGDYKVLPGSFYVRAFVKTYAEMVGLNPDEIVQSYRDDVLASGPEQIEPSICTRKPSVQADDRLHRWASKLLKGSFIILIAVILYSFAVKYVKPRTLGIDTAGKTNVTEKEKPYVTLNDRTADSSAREDNKKVAVQQLTEPKSALQQEPIIVLESSKHSEDSYQVSALKPVKVEIKANGGRCWLEVWEKDNRKGKLHYDTLEKNQVLNINMFELDIFIRVGNARLIEISVAGQPLNSLDYDGPKNVRLRWLPHNKAQKRQMEKQEQSTGTTDVLA